MKKKWKRNSLMVSLFMLLGSLAACNRFQKAKDKSAATAAAPIAYTCPMHPQIISDHPGSCPICGMDLVRRTTDEKDTVHIPAGLNELVKSPNQVVVSNIGVIQPKEAIKSDTLKAPGVITYDPRHRFTIAARFSGRIEKLYLRYPYQPVQKGQLVAEIYSPEMVTAQRELLYIAKTDKKNQDLIRSATQKLRLLGATAAQIQSLLMSGRELYRFPVYSPYSGYLTGASATPPPAMTPSSPVSSGNDMGESSGVGESSDMGSAASSSAAPGIISQNQSTLLQEGAYVTTGQTLFTVINPNQLWAEININNEQATVYRKGMQVTLVPDGSQPVIGFVELIQPFYDQGSSFTKVRVSFRNPSGSLRIGQLVQAMTKPVSQQGLWVPQVAVLDLGTRKVVFEKRDHAFVPVTVITGTQVKDWVQIKKGVTSTDVLAANAQYLIDSESFVETNQGKP